MRKFCACFVFLLATAACGTKSTTSAGTSPTPSDTNTAMSGAASCTPNGSSLKETVKNLMYQSTCLAAPMNTAFTIAFDNEDSGTTHSMIIFNSAIMNDSAPILFNGAIVTGVKTMVYNVKALPAGSYHFHCQVHPTTMQGTLVVR